MSSFSNLGLCEPLCRAVHDLDYTTPTPIQAAAIPALLEGRDLVGAAKTGTGKTAAFALPVLQLLDADGVRRRPGRPRALVLTPTRELAIQIDRSFQQYGVHLDLTGTVIFGGVSQRPQQAALRRGLDILVATPGRLLDLMGQGIIDLGDVEIFVLDEADRMLDMGFLPDVRRVLAALPAKRHTLLFSATMPPDIVALSRGMLDDPVHVEVDRESSTADNIAQRVIFVEKKGKQALLADVVRDSRVKRALVFTRTKHGANRVVKRLQRVGVGAAAIHGNKSQNSRQRALEDFRRGDVTVLVATDLASRGLDVEHISHVINYELPNIPESYVHRIGRTARAGASGLAISFCDEEEVAYLRDIERLIGKRVKVAGDRIGLPDDVVAPGPIDGEPRRASRGRSGSRGRRRGGSGRRGRR